MSTVFETNELSFCETVFETVMEQAADADISLPDYCPDIERVLNCEAVPGVNALTVADGKMTLDACVTLRVLYAGSDGRLCTFERAVPFQRSVESAEINKSTAGDAALSCGFVNCRAVGPRRLDIHTTAACRFRADKKKTEKIMSSASGDGVLCLTGEYDTVSVTGKTVKFFPMSETAELEKGRGDIAGILNVDACISTNEEKVIKDKMLVKGGLSVTVFYIDEGGEVESLVHTMPFSRIIELEGMDENNICRLRTDVAGVEAVPAVDADGKTRLVEISARVRTELSACTDVKITLVKDAYSTEKEISLKTKGVETNSLIDSFSEPFTSHCTVEPGTFSPDRVLMCTGGAPTCEVTVNGFSAKLTGSFEVGILLMTTSGEPEYIKKSVNFDFSRHLKKSAEKVKCMTAVRLAACSCTVTADNKLEIKGELVADCSVYSANTVKCINGITVEGKKEDRGGAALTVYYADEGERLWDIAKKYGSTVEAIADENEFDGVVTERKTMLVIPGV